MEGMDEVEMRLFSWGMKRVKIYTYIYRKNKTNKQKKTPFATTVTNVRNTCTEVLAVNP